MAQVYMSRDPTHLVTKPIKYTINSISFKYYDLTKQCRPFKPLRKGHIENILEKGNQHFLLFPQMFSTLLQQISNIGIVLFCRLQMLSIWTILTFGHVVKSSPPLSAIALLIYCTRYRYLQLVLVWPTGQVFVYILKVNPVHTILK